MKKFKQTTYNDDMLSMMRGFMLAFTLFGIYIAFTEYAILFSIWMIFSYFAIVLNRKLNKFFLDN